MSNTEGELNYDKTLRKQWLLVLHYVCRRQEHAPKIVRGQRELSDLEKTISEAENIAQVDQRLLARGKKILEKYFYIEIEPKGDVLEKLGTKSPQPKVAVFRVLIPPLTDYLTIRRKRIIDLPSYYLSPDEKPAGNHCLALSESKLFRQIDDNLQREGRRWTLNKKDGSGPLIVRPPETFDELYRFMNSQSPYCFFDWERNQAQMYLYVAHKNIRLLGIWDPADKDSAPPGKPLGLVPLLLMRMKENDAPVLSVEFPFLNKKGSADEHFDPEFQQRDGKLISFDQALLDIILIYSLLLKERPLPVIGSCRKDDNPYYSSIFKRFLSAAAESFDLPSWFPHTKNKVLVRNYKGRDDKTRSYTKALHEGEAEVYLPKDERLWKFIRDNTKYRFDDLMMFSQNFLGDEQGKRELLFKEWGPMQGRMHFVPIKEYFGITAELEDKKWKR